MILGFTGTGKKHPTDAQLRTLLFVLEQGWLEAHHGDCIFADEIFHSFCLAAGVPVHVHPPEDDKKRAFCVGYARRYTPKPYLERNRAIVNCTTELVAVPSLDVEETRSGTWATVRAARSMGRRIHIILQNGEMRSE